MNPALLLIIAMGMPFLAFLLCINFLERREMGQIKASNNPPTPKASTDVQ